MATQWRRAFTLVELLVVLGIIAVLLALLLPTLARARRQARSVVCLAHLRELASAYQVYVNQNGGKSLIGYGSPENHWVRVLRPYLNGADDIWYCPEAPENVGHRVDPNGSPYVGTAFHAWAQSRFEDQQFVVDIESSYGMNGWLSALRSTGSIPMGEPGRDLYITLPATEADRIPVFGDCAIAGLSPLSSDRPPNSLTTPVPTAGTNNVNVQGMHAFCMARHGRAINVVFLDGHARTVPLEELWQLKWNRQFVPTTVTLPRE